MSVIETMAADDLDGDLFDGGGAQLSDHHAEQALLGYLLHKPGAITDTIEILKPSDLHDPLHRRIYELLLKAYDSDAPVTMEALVAGLGGEKSCGVALARLLAEADLQIDVGETADHLWGISERRAVGSADDIDWGAPFVSKFGGLRWEEIGAGPAADLYPWLVEDIIPLNDISMAFGHTGTGKSFNVFDMAMCVARGIPFNGRNVEPGLVVYVAAEAGKGFAKRKIAYAIHHNLEPTEPLPFVLLTKRPNFFQDDTDVLALIDEIAAIIKMYKLPLVLIVVDTMSAITCGMDEISGRDQSVVRRRLLMLQERFNSSVLVVHHKPKDGNGPRGHGSQSADIETTIEFETLSDRHRATVRKQREGKSGICWEFTLPVVEVGRNRWNNPETSCVVRVCGEKSQTQQRGVFHVTPTEQLFMTALFESIVDHGVAPPAGLPLSITKVVQSSHVRSLMRSRSIAPHEDCDVADTRFRVAFKRAGDKLRDGGVLGVQGSWFWHTGKPIVGRA